MKEQLKVLIPAAGYGRRVGTPEAKEMLPGPDGKPMISWALDLAESRGWKVTVATRREKQSLVQYLETRGIEIVELEPTREWPETVLQTRSSWGEWNLLFLPDCVFEPVQALDEMWKKIGTQKGLAIAATFPVESGRTWGCLRLDSNSVWSIAEKPRESQTQMLAWGLWLFHQDVGEELFQKCLKSQLENSWEPLSFQIETVNLTSFRDLTRISSRT